MPGGRSHNECSTWVLNSCMWGQNDIFKVSHGYLNVYVTIFSMRMGLRTEKHAEPQLLFQANFSPASGDFAVAGTSKWISPTSPQAINGLFFLCLSSLVS